MNIDLNFQLFDSKKIAILTIKENDLDPSKIKENNLFKQSLDYEYNTNFTKSFRDFDKSNGYKGLKFGMQLQNVKTIVKLKAPDQFKQYGVLNEVYKVWFYRKFDFCNLSFNKEKQLYDVDLDRDEFSNNDYETFLKDAIDLFGTPNELRKAGDQLETTRWVGKNMYIAIVRFYSVVTRPKFTIH